MTADPASAIGWLVDTSALLEAVDGIKFVEGSHISEDVAGDAPVID